MNEKTVGSRRVFDGRLLKVDVLDVELESGKRSVREIVRHPGAAVILGQLPDDRFVFVRQFRKPLEADIIEAVAGTLEPGEDPIECAAREVKEETGYEAINLKKLGVIVSSPGYTDETLHVYFAQLAADQGELQSDEDEQLDVVYLTKDRVEKMIVADNIRDAKTLAAWLLYEKSGIGNEDVSEPEIEWRRSR